jgi:hypothetical protein
MNWKQKTCLWIGVAVIVLMGLFPPWESHYGSLVAYSFTMYPPCGRCFVDTSSLCLQWFTVTVVTGGLIVTLADKKPKGQRKQSMHFERGLRRRVFVLSLLGACLGICVFFALTANVLVRSETGERLGLAVYGKEYVYTPTSSGVAVCILAGIVIGGPAGFGLVWLIYYFIRNPAIRWLVLGFVEDEQKDEQKQ